MNGLPRKYYIFRHGETFVTKGLRFNYGLKIFSADILEEGKPALKRMGDYIKKIKTDFNASSQFKRCRQTVGIVSAQSGKEFVFDSRLNEFLFELPFFFRRRVKSFLNFVDRSGYESVMICTHGAVINELIRAINSKAFPVLAKEKHDPRPPVQTEVSRKSLQLENEPLDSLLSAKAESQVSFTKYLSPAVLLILTENSVQEVNFNR